MSSYLLGVWQYQDEVLGDPGSGNVNLDSSVTTLCVSSTDYAGNPATELSQVAAGDRVLVQEVSDSTNFAWLQVVADPVDHGTWLEVPVDIESAGSEVPRRNEQLQLGFTHTTASAPWPYATVAELAQALRVRPTADNTAVMERCLEAAAEEIDADLDRVDPLPYPYPAAIVGTNIARAVEWWKAADAAYGIIGFEDTGAIRAPRDGFARHSSTITPWKQLWGVA